MPKRSGVTLMSTKRRTTITGHGRSKDESRNYGEYELKLMLSAIQKLPNPFVKATAGLAEGAE